MANVGNNDTDPHIFCSEIIIETHKSDYSFSDPAEVNPKRALTQNPSKKRAKNFCKIFKGNSFETFHVLNFLRRDFEDCCILRYTRTIIITGGGVVVIVILLWMMLLLLFLWVLLWFLLLLLVVVMVVAVVVVVVVVVVVAAHNHFLDITKVLVHRPGCGSFSCHSNNKWYKIYRENNNETKKLYLFVELKKEEVT